MVVEVRSVPKWARGVFSTLHGSGRQLTQHLELLCHKLHSLEAHAGSVAARPPRSVMNVRRFMGCPPQTGGRTLPHRYANTLLCITAKLIVEWQRLGQTRSCRFHSITSSARASSVGGMSRPSTLAVATLITNSNLVGCTTGRSAGVRRGRPGARPVCISPRKNHVCFPPASGLF